MDSHTKLIRAEDVGLVKTDVFLGLDGELTQAHSLNPDLDQDLILDQNIWILGQNRMMYRMDEGDNPRIIRLANQSKLTVLDNLTYSCEISKPNVYKQYCKVEDEQSFSYSNAYNKNKKVEVEQNYHNFLNRDQADGINLERQFNARSLQLDEFPLKKIETKINFNSKVRQPTPPLQLLDEVEFQCKEEYRPIREKFAAVNKFSLETGARPIRITNSSVTDLRKKPNLLEVDVATSEVTEPFLYERNKSKVKIAPLTIVKTEPPWFQTDEDWTPQFPSERIDEFRRGVSIVPVASSVASAPLVGSQKRKARKQTITRLDPSNLSSNRDISVVESSVLSKMLLEALAEVALIRPLIERPQLQKEGEQTDHRTSKSTSWILERSLPTNEPDFNLEEDYERTSSILKCVRSIDENEQYGTDEINNLEQTDCRTLPDMKFERSIPENEQYNGVEEIDILEQANCSVSPCFKLERVIPDNGQILSNEDHILELINVQRSPILKLERLNLENIMDHGIKDNIVYDLANDETSPNLKLERSHQREQELSKEDRTVFRCRECNCGFNLKSDFRQHVISVHEIHKCDECDKTFTRSAGLSRHIQLFHKKGDNLESSASGNKSTKKRNMPITNFKSDNNELTPFECQDCHTIFLQESHLSIHIAAAHNKLKPFVCSECKMTFTKKRLLAKHFTLVHENAELVKGTYREKSLLNVYISGPEKLKPYKCTECDRTYKSRKCVTQHIFAVHRNPRPFSCPECNSTFNTKIILRRHVLALHRKLKLFKCNYCERSFGRKGCLVRHITTVHDKIKLFKCPECENMFSLKSHLAQHFKGIHLKLRQYKCQECCYTTSRKENLVMHIQSVHWKLKPHQCKDCKREFSWKNCLTRHIQLVHRNT